MNKVSIALNNCYGIKSLRYEFDFSKGPVYAIYAPNGVMKSSLMLTFRAVSEGGKPEDRIYKTRVSKAEILDEHGTALQPESIFTVRHYDEEYSATEKIATLLVNKKLQKEYVVLHKGISKAKDVFLAGIQKQANSKRDFEREISSVFTSTDNDLAKALTRIQKEVTNDEDTAPLAAVAYERVFHETILQFLEQNKEAKTALNSYVSRLNELLAQSRFFRKGTFDYYNAATIAATLTKHGFFAAKHTVILNSAKQAVTISTQKELEDIIETEKNAIFKDPALQKEFNQFSKQLWRNEILRDFQSYLLEHEHLVPSLANIRKFKEDVLTSYIKTQLDLYNDLLAQYEAATSRRKNIVAQAVKERTQWDKVISIFKDRFVVPFDIEIKNKSDAVLGAAPALAFSYNDGTERVDIAEDQLMTTLSTGERKALYILHIIFAVEARLAEGTETLIIIDDLADSFDYQNKYAIIEYLNDQKESGLFKHIVMTHNFDFFRTINLRFVGNYSHCLMARKDESGITLEQGAGIRDVFLNDLRDNFFCDPKKRIACIPFIRNVVEMMRDDKDPLYAKLTSLLHWKPDTMSITEAQLDDCYNAMFAKKGASKNGNRAVVESIHEEAEKCVHASVGMNFDNKIVLAIGARLAAEKYMIDKMNDPRIYDDIVANQTHELFQKYKKHGGNNGDISVLGRVVLMTPENIHLNSFMYEPIIDMSDQHLRKLYADVKALR